MLETIADLYESAQFASWVGEGEFDPGGYGDLSGYDLDDNGNPGWNPVILDLDGDGIEITELGSSNTFFDMAGDGYKHRTAWAGVGDGVLAIDADGDGKIDQQKEVVFTQWDPTAASDMQALRNIFDTNHNGQLDAGDDRYGDFRVVVTLADGSTAVRTFAQAGIASIGLTEDKTSQVFSDGSSIDGQTTLTKTNGQTRTVATVTLAADAAGHAIRTTKVVNSDGSTTITNRMLGADGSVASEVVSTISADGLTRMVTFDDDGNGVVDRSQSDVTVVNSDGSRTRTLSNTDQTGILVDRTTTTSSDDGASVTISRDTNGNGVADQSELRVTNTDGSRTVTIRDLNPNGTTRSQSVATTSIDGQTRTTTFDVNGDATIDLTQVDATVTAGDGTRTRTVTETNTDGSLRDRTQTISSADGAAQTVKIDANGDGIFELVRTSAIVRNTDGSTTTTDTDKSANGGLISSRATTTSADGLSVTTVQDLDGDGDVDLSTSDVTVVNASNRVQTITESDGSGGLLRKTVITKGAANGLSGSTRVDTDGDGNDDQVEQIGITPATGEVTDTLTTYSPDGTVVTSKTVTKTDADGLGKTVTFDYNGDNANDLVRAVATVVNADGSSTVTSVDQARNNALIGKTEATTSADGLTVTTRSDVDGDGANDFTTTSTTVVGGTGAITTTETTTSKNSTRQSRRSTVVSANRNTTTIRDDLDGDTKNDRVDAIAKQSNGTIVETLATYSRAEVLTSQIITTTSADGLSVTIAADIDGSGTTDLTTTDVTVLNADGSRQATVSVLGPTNSLRNRLITTETASGLSRTVEEDLDGNGSIDLTTTDVTTISTSGVRQRSIIDKAGTTVVGTTSVQASRSGLSITTDVDADGDGDIDTHTTDVTSLGATGSKTRTVTDTNLDASMRGRTQTVTSRDGKSVTTRDDLDGSGTWDRIETIVKQADGIVVQTATGYDFGTGAKNFGSSETTSAGGTNWTRKTDENGDGVDDETETRTTTYNADGSKRETYTDLTTGWNVAPGEYANSITKHIDVSANGLSKTTTFYGTVRLYSVSHTATDVTTLKADGGREQNITASHSINSIGAQNSRRITTDAHGFYRKEELDFFNDGSVNEAVERIVNVDGSVTDSFFRDLGGGFSYERVVDTSANGLVVTTGSDTDFDGVLDLFSTSEKKADGSVVESVQYKNDVGLLKNSTTTTTSFDGRMVIVEYDMDGNGTTDRSEETATIINANGTKTTTRSDYNKAGALQSRIASTTSANGLSITATIDLDGDGVVDETFSDVSVLRDDGSASRTVKTLYDDGSKKNQTWITTSADGLTKTTRQDTDGDGVYDIVTAENTYASGMKTVVVSRYDASNALRSRDTTTTSANGSIVRQERDVDGDGDVDNKNFVRDTAGQGGSYTASMQDFMNSGSVLVYSFSDEAGISWFKYTSGAYTSPLFFDTERYMSLTKDFRSKIYDVVVDRDMMDVEGTIGALYSSFGQTMTDLIGGTEFAQKYGTLTNAQFVERLHENAYNRGATLTELKSWLTRLLPGGGATKQDLVWDLANSAEHATVGNIHAVTSNTFNISGVFERDHTTDKKDAKTLVDRLYVTALDRHIGSTNSYIPMILDGTRTESQIAGNLVLSSEFQTKYGTLSDQAFIAQMIENGYGRAAKNAEKTSWATLLGNGTISRADFVVAIASSPDYSPGIDDSLVVLPPENEDSAVTHAGAGSGVTAMFTAGASAQVQAAGNRDDVSMLRLTQAMASMTPQSASDSIFSIAAIPAPEHQLASPLH